jgi:uncharacterized coiled-coil protein SlyX
MKKLITITLMMMSMLGCQQIKPEEITKPLNDKISAIEEKIKSIESWIEEQKKAAEEAPKTAQEMSKAIGDLKKSVDELKGQVSSLSSRLSKVEQAQKVMSYYYTDCVPGSSSGPIYYLSSPVNGACNELSGFTITSYIKEDPSFNGVVTDPGNSTYEVLNSNRKYALKFTISGKTYYALATTGASVGSSVTLNFKVQTIPNLRIIGQ